MHKINGKWHILLYPTHGHMVRASTCQLLKHGIICTRKAYDSHSGFRILHYHNYLHGAEIVDDRRCVLNGIQHVMKIVHTQSSRVPEFPELVKCLQNK